MCKISDQIKFCTCGPDIDIEDLENYWIFYRRNPDKNEMIIGDTLLPSELDPKDLAYNHQTLKKRINESDAFDLPLESQSGDRLLIHLTTPMTNITSVDEYEFVFKEAWKSCESNSWELMGMFDALRKRKVSQLRSSK